MRLPKCPASHEVGCFGLMLPDFAPCRSCLSEGDATYILPEVLMWRRVISERFTSSFIHILQLLFIHSFVVVCSSHAMYVSLKSIELSNALRTSLCYCEMKAPSHFASLRPQ